MEELNLDQTFYYEDNIPVKWTRFGNVNGPPLVFCHGTPWSSQLWVPIARCFTSDFSIYMYDMPGYGQSIPSPTATESAGFKPTYPAQTAVFCALLQHWKATGNHDTFTPHIVAHDIGGHIALRAHLLKSVHFASLALVDCGASYPVDEPFFSLVRENASTFTSLPSNLHAALLREYIRGASHRGLLPSQEDTLAQSWLSPTGQKAFYAQIAAQKNSDIEDLRRAYGKVDIPLRILWARNDTWVPVERAFILSEVLGGSLEIIEDAGHLVQFDATERVVAELVGWLNGVRDRRYTFLFTTGVSKSVPLSQILAQFTR